MEKKTSVTNILRNVMPAFAVMALGLGGAYLVYENYFSDRIEGSKYSAIAPAAGTEMGNVEGIDGITSDMKVMVSDMAEQTEHTMEAAGDMAHDAMETTGEMATDAAAAADEGMHDAMDTVTETAEEAVDDGEEMTEQAAEETQEVITEDVENAATEATDSVEDAAESMEAVAPAAQ